MVEEPPFPVFSLLGEWRIHWDMGAAWNLYIEEQEGYVFYGYLRPDSTMEYYYQVMGGVYVGYDNFGFSCRDINMIYNFQCIMEPSLIKFIGICRLYDYNGLELGYGADFYAVKVG